MHKDRVLSGLTSPAVERQEHLSKTLHSKFWSSRKSLAGQPIAQLRQANTAQQPNSL
ncbi:Uncharacterised protein [Vibrio cholerae]|nr:Uncharacterised protein [Vibrio cholerae]